MKESSSSFPHTTLAFARSGRSFVATEVDDATLAQHARQLRDWYNAAENASMMGGATDLDDTDVRAFVRELRASGGRWFLLGATFATMLHVFAFRDLGLERIYVQPKRENVRVQRLERSLGYTPDDSPEALSHADAGDDVITMSISADTFRAGHAEAWANVDVS